MMNKKHIFAVAGATIIAAAVVTFIALRRPSVDAYASVIPADAKAIVRIDPQQLVSEADLSAPDMMKLLKRILISDEAESTGLDLARPFFTFVGGGGDLGIVARVDDVALLEQRLNEQKDEGYATEVTRQRDISWTLIAGQWLMAFDDEKALFMGPVGGKDDYLRSMMTQLMRQKRDASGMASELYLDLNSRHAPVVASVAGDMLPKDLQSTINTYLNVSRLADIRLGAELHTQGNEMTLDLELESDDEEFDKTLKELEDLMDPIRGDLIQHASASPLLWVCVGIDGGDLLEVLRRSQDARFVLILLNAVADVDAIINDIDGDVVFEVLDANLTKPRCLLTAQLDDDFESFKDAPYWLKSATKAAGYDLRQTSPTDFVFDNDGFEVCFGTKDNVLYVSSSDKLMPQSDAKAPASYIASQKKMIRGQRFYAMLDLTTINYDDMDMGFLLKPYVGDLQRVELLMPEVNKLQLRLLAPEGTNIARSILFSAQD